jgi:hypothetical protein
MRRRLKSIDSKKFDNRIPMSKNTNAEDDSYKDQQIPKYTGREKKKKIRNSKWNDDEENDYYLTLLLNILLNKEKMAEQKEIGSGSYNL